MELQDIRLGSLLPAKQIRLLEAVFLSNEVVSSNAGGGAREGSVETDTSAELSDRFSATVTCVFSPRPT